MRKSYSRWDDTIRPPPPTKSWKLRRMQTNMSARHERSLRVLLLGSSWLGLKRITEWDSWHGVKWRTRRMLKSFLRIRSSVVICNRYGTNETTIPVINSDKGSCEVSTYDIQFLWTNESRKGSLEVSTSVLPDSGRFLNDILNGNLPLHNKSSTPPRWRGIFSAGSQIPCANQHSCEPSLIFFDNCTH